MAEQQHNAPTTPERRIKNYEIPAAIIMAAASIIAAIIGLRSCSARNPAPAVADVWITGRVTTQGSEEPIRKAEVTLDASGVPATTETDSKGVFTTKLPADYATVRIRVSAVGFEPYDQLLPRGPSSEVISIALVRKSHKVTTTSQDDGRRIASPLDRRPSQPAVTQASLVPSFMNTPARSVVGEDGPWSVIVFGDQDARTEVVSGLESVLRLAGKETVSMFRKVSDEQRFAPELFRGSADVYQQLQIGRHSSHVLVAKLAVARTGETNGITFATAKLTVNVLSPAAEVLQSFELSERDGGNDEAQARQRAVAALIDTFPIELPKRIR